MTINTDRYQLRIVVEPDPDWSWTQQPGYIEWPKNDDGSYPVYDRYDGTVIDDEGEHHQQYGAILLVDGDETFQSLWGIDIYAYDVSTGDYTLSQLKDLAAKAKRDGGYSYLADDIMPDLIADYEAEQGPALGLDAPLTTVQREALDHYAAYNVPGQWFVGAQGPEGRELLFLGDGFAWSIIVDNDGDVSTQEATVGPFQTGVEV